MIKKLWFGLVLISMANACHAANILNIYLVSVDNILFFPGKIRRTHTYVAKYSCEPATYKFIATFYTPLDLYDTRHFCKDCKGVFRCKDEFLRHAFMVKKRPIA